MKKIWKSYWEKKKLNYSYNDIEEMKTIALCFYLPLILGVIILALIFIFL